MDKNKVVLGLVNTFMVVAPIVAYNVAPNRSYAADLAALSFALAFFRAGAFGEDAFVGKAAKFGKASTALMLSSLLLSGAGLVSGDLNENPMELTKLEKEYKGKVSYGMAFRALEAE